MSSYRYSLTDSSRLQNVVFEKWATLSIGSAKPVQVDIPKQPIFITMIGIGHTRKQGAANRSIDFLYGRLNKTYAAFA